ncbi:ComEA family DNA-binding protein [Bifidobacterium callitrichos]|uniref:ComEA family DNA-binding protein n=1 Tax=Bifidobacterium callitrichos TaxID=762209 RepID=UPI00168AF91B|nr:helix-hairpin-helix domain-containing protein [Bifidobacterium callitrichos]
MQPVTTYTTSSPPSHSSHPSPDDDSTIRRSESLSLSRLTGVNGADTSVDEFERRARHGRPRLRFTATHALAAILIMTFVTCMSLTLLIQQSINYAAIDGARHTQEQTADPGASDADGDETDSNGQTGSDDADKTADDAETSTEAGDGTSEPQSAPTAPDPADPRLDLNTATLEQLDAIPGIGPVTAQKILDHRQRIGRFTSVDQLLDVSGIGAKTLEKIRPKVRV